MEENCIVECELLHSPFIFGSTALTSVCTLLHGIRCIAYRKTPSKIGNLLGLVNASAVLLSVLSNPTF